MSQSRKNNFLMQGAILAVASIVVRIIGLVYRIPLNNILGEKGVAYYGVAYDVYSILLLLSSYSLPLAVSKMVANKVALGEFRNTREILILTVCFAAVCGVAAFCITFFGANWFAKILNYPQAAVALRVLSPALVILAIMGVFRGYFQGRHSMVPTAVSQIVEQIINAVVSIVAAKALFDSMVGYDQAQYSFSNVPEAYGAAGGTLGTVCGAAVGLIYLLVLFFKQRKRRLKFYALDDTGANEKNSKILKILIWTIVPVIISTTIYNISSLLDSGIFSNVMDSLGMDHDSIDTLTGMYTGNYRLIINVPVALASALASSLIPALVKARTEKNRKAVKMQVRTSIKISMIVAFPCAVGIGVLSLPIMNLLFPSSVDPEKVSLMLMIGCISVVLYTLSTITNSILQGIDKMSLPVIHSAIALGIHILLLIGMLYILRIDIFAVVIADALFALIVCILNAFSLRKHLGFKQEVKRTFVIPIISAIVMGIFTYLVYHGVKALIGSNLVAVIISFIISVVVYFVALLLLKGLNRREIEMFPKGDKIVRVLRKFRLI